MINSLALRLLAIALVLSGTPVSPAAAGPRATDMADFSLEASAAPDPVSSGSQVTVTFVVTNSGPDDAGAVVRTSTPEGTTFHSATASGAGIMAPSVGGTGTITASFDNIEAPNGRPAVDKVSDSVNVVVVFNVTADPGAVLMFEGTVSPGAGFSDPEPENDDAAVSVQVAAAGGTPANVAVEIAPLADEAGSGALFSYNVDVTNLSEGDETAQGVKVTIDIPEGASFAEVDSDADACSTPEPGGGGTVVCSFSQIAPGETSTSEVTVRVLAMPGHTLDLTASVAAATPDPDHSNDAAEAFVDVVPSPQVLLDWDEPDQAAPTEFPPPRDLVVEEQGTPSIARFVCLTRVDARRDAVAGYNVYGSTTPGVVPSPGTLLTSVPPSQTSTTVPAAPSGTFFVVTATYPGGESAPSNEASGEVPAGTIASVKATGTKITVTGTNFSDVVSVFVDGIPFASPAKVKKAGTKVVQKGSLLTGQTVAAYLQTHPNVLVTVRNSNGGVAAFRYPR